MTPTEITTLADHLSSQSLQWLFIFTLIVLGVFGMLVLRYMVKQHERLIDDHSKAREGYQKTLLEIVAKQAEAYGQTAKIIEGNTAALAACTHELQLCRVHKVMTG